MCSDIEGGLCVLFFVIHMTSSGILPFVYRNANDCTVQDTQFIRISRASRLILGVWVNRKGRIV